MLSGFGMEKESYKIKKRHFFISKKLQISDMKEPNIKLDVVITKEMVFHKILKKL